LSLRHKVTVGAVRNPGPPLPGWSHLSFQPPHQNHLRVLLEPTRL
ncbi:hypothetical protein T12_10862, partial [Trichinella patagoniensis]